jgi:hypothetical protein
MAVHGKHNFTQLTATFCARSSKKSNYCCNFTSILLNAYLHHIITKLQTSLLLTTLPDNYSVKFSY